MPRHNSAFDELEKPCEGCGARIRFRDLATQALSRFRQQRFCSRRCADDQRRTKFAPRPFDVKGSFWSRVDKDAAGDCWEWRGPTSAKGYGALSVDGVKTKAHRFSFELHNGPIPDGLMVLHSCDNRLCCNPEHLRVGTAQDNADDATTRNRWNRQPRPRGAATQDSRPVTT